MLAKGIPTFFVTLSSADLHWPNLHDAINEHLKGRNVDYMEDVGQKRKRATKMQNIANNPHIVSGFFVERAERMFNEVYGDVIKDIWYIFEWQSRGSIHLHGLLWMNDAPSLPTPDVLLAAKNKILQKLGKRKTLSREEDEKLAETEEKLQAWSDYYDKYCGGINGAIIDEQDTEGAPDYDNAYYKNPAVEILPKLSCHPCGVAGGSLPEETDRKYLINFCQRHIKRKPGARLKKNKRTGKEECENGALWRTGN